MKVDALMVDALLPSKTVVDVRDKLEDVKEK
jgi:hypothetical protein